MTVMLSTNGNNEGSELSGIKPSNRRRMGAGATVKAIKPTVMAPRFLPNFLETTGAIKNASTADMTTLREMRPICSVVNSQKKVEK